MTLVDLPDIKFVEDDVDKVFAELVTIFQGITGRILNRADPDMLALRAFGMMFVQQRVLINQVAKGELLRYAKGVILDHLGDPETPRLQAEPALTTERFTLSIPLVTPQVIPAGTRVAPEGAEGSILFATKNAVTIPAGVTSIDVLIECVTPGVIGNGFLSGQVNTLIDPLPFVASVTNLTTTTGGADTEDDDSYRERIRMAPESFSTAGPEQGYIYWAKTASAAIVDVAAVSESPVEVTVVPLLEGGVIPTQEILDAVAEKVNGRRIRPLTDKVTVQAPAVVPYNIELTYYISSDRAAESLVIRDAVEKAVASYALWQKSKLGRHINQSELIGRIMNVGALRVNVVSPVYTPITDLQVAQDVTINATFGGFAND
ncbi:Phage-related baseplate assembly protein [Paenibacillus uliginis N3/975]|uniref:Phage-related baseplate assembly protein n=1 Tax=Paenibacillus uliginis N3/975 TaxID=1313296 RepID=A0A1X7HKA8_9BACL|nr:baseplate J/gp47 family protein [Paenibacillus uliginis]SMF88134.1 Phage-related baseplate assembly protein [Paenibacillus uliginis N3/975]